MKLQHVLNPLLLTAICIAGLTHLGVHLLEKDGSDTDLALTEGHVTPTPKTALSQPNKTEKVGNNKNHRASSEIETVFKERFDDSIHLASGKIKFIDQLSEFLKKQYGIRWQAHFQSLIQRIYPQHSTEIMELYAGITQYRTWVISQKPVLQTMSRDEKNLLLWTQRKAIFGETLALSIWKSSLQKERVQAVLDQLNQNKNDTFTHQVTTYLNEIYDVYGDDTEKHLQLNQLTTIDQFLSLQTVQSNLIAMSQEDRTAALASLRRKLGMEKSAVQKWQDLDTLREQRRSNGILYMQQRMGLNKLELAKLQNKLFGQEADVIREEEKNGYYRFKRPQIIGLN